MALKITNFSKIRPPYNNDQRSLTEWIIKAHIEAKRLSSGWDKEHSEYALFGKELSEKMLKIGVGPDKIQRRGTILPDTVHENWSEMAIYRLNENSAGLGFKARTQFFDAALDGIFNQFYSNEQNPPAHIVHVTCTGYASPSAAQRLVSRNGWFENTVVTHAYHMGCYAALPAIRIAHSCYPADIVHTEICSLHLNPLMHESEQLVVQSLFADGFIKYSLTDEKITPSLSIIATLEQIIPDTTNSMSWICEDWGLRMKIAKEVPVQISRALEKFVKKLLEKSVHPLKKEDLFFALHPGGPKVIQQIAGTLGLEEWQIVHSKEVLFNYGNMSSATLPHIWEKILQDSSIPSGAAIVTLAYGPGLTLSGAVFIKET